MFTTRRPRPSFFLSRGYLAVSEEPEVAVAAVGLRAALADEELAVRTSASGVQTHSDGAVLSVVAAEEKLRRRVKRVLQRQIGEAEAAAAERGLW